MRRLLSFMMLLAVVLSASAKSIEIAGVKYTTHGSTVSAKAAIANNPMLVNLVLKETVAIDGREYTLTEIENNGFAKQRALKVLILPNSVRKIGAGAFVECTALETAVIPDMAEVGRAVGFYGFTLDGGPFSGCTSLRTVRGQTVALPDYAVNSLFVGSEDVPFVQTINEHLANLRVEEYTAAYGVVDAAALTDAPQTAPAAVSGRTSAPSRASRGDIVDRDIPDGGIRSDRTFALIIGNENYTSPDVPTVDYAVNDAEVFAQYCRKTLGLPEKNVRLYLNITYGPMITAINDLRDIAAAYKGDVNLIVYFSGHGLPNEASKEAYLLPIDATGLTTDGTYSLRRLYEELGETPSRGTLVLLDACFSGASRGAATIASGKRAARLAPRAAEPTGKVVVFSASSGTQTAWPYEEKGHGLFTYYLLEKLRETRGKVSLGELFEHIEENVSQQSVVTNHKAQVPVCTPSREVEENWTTMRVAVADTKNSGSGKTRKGKRR